MIVEPLSFREFVKQENLDAVPSEEQRNLYLGFRYELVRKFRDRFPPACRIDFNYTLGFCAEMEAWCDARTADWELLCNYGHDWPLGFKDASILFEFKMRWL